MLVVVVGIHIPKCLSGGVSLTVSSFVSPGWCLVVRLTVCEGGGVLLGCWLGRGSDLSLCEARGLGCLRCHVWVFLHPFHSGLMG